MAEDSHDASSNQLVKRVVIKPQARTNRSSLERLAKRTVSKLQRIIFRKSLKSVAKSEDISRTHVSHTTLKTNDDKLI